MIMNEGFRVVIHGIENIPVSDIQAMSDIVQIDGRDYPMEIVRSDYVEIGAEESVDFMSLCDSWTRNFFSRFADTLTDYEICWREKPRLTFAHPTSEGFIQSKVLTVYIRARLAMIPSSVPLKSSLT